MPGRWTRQRIGGMRRRARGRTHRGMARPWLRRGQGGVPPKRAQHTVTSRYFPNSARGNAVSAHPVARAKPHGEPNPHWSTCTGAPTSLPSSPSPGKGPPLGSGACPRCLPPHPSAGWCSTSTTPWRTRATRRSGWSRPGPTSAVTGMPPPVSVNPPTTTPWRSSTSSGSTPGPSTRTASGTSTRGGTARSSTGPSPRGPGSTSSSPTRSTRSCTDSGTSTTTSSRC